MQKLLVEPKNAPMDTPQVHSTVSSTLNSPSGVMDSVRSRRLTNNSSDVDSSQHRGSSGLRVQNIVYVLNMRGKPLMPTTQQKANKLSRQDKAKVIRCNPFTIQLNYATGEAKQPIILGVDAGYSRIGFSAISGSKELISGEVKLRNDVSKKLTERRMYRRQKRNKLWYREPRWNNRVSSKKKEWLAPSIKHKLDSHIRLVNKIKELLPISRVVVEVANFDIQKIKNPNIEGKDYQEGEQLGFYNVREYVLDRDKHICQYCKGMSKDKILQIHHIRGKKEGATNRPEELITVCKICHNNHHKGIISIPIKKIKTFKPETFMSTVRWKLVNILRCQWTYGYITKHNRIKLGLKKSHSNDAFVIADGNNQLRSVQYTTNQIRRNNRALQLNRKGFKPSVRKQRYSFQPYNLVNYNGQILEVKGVHCLGKRIMLENKKSVKIENVKLYKYMRGWQFLPTLTEGSPCHKTDEKNSRKI